MIILQNVVKTFKGDGASSQRIVLNGLSMAIHPGERVAVLGPNGAGKTTLMRLLASQIAPDSGIVSCNGIPGSKIGYVTQNVNASIFSGLTLLEHLFVASSAGTFLNATVSQELMKQLHELCPLLSALIRDYPEAFSGGEKQLVAISLALISRPDIILLDEPTGSLDTANFNHFWVVLQGYLNQNPKCILVLVTHNMAEVVQVATRVIIIREGQIIEEMQTAAGGLDVTVLSSKLWPQPPAMEIGYGRR